MKVLDAGIAEYAAVARRHAADWYAAATANWTARSLEGCSLR
jgi:hypothetical protein